MNELEHLREENDRLRKAYIELLNLCDFDQNPMIPIEQFKLLDTSKWYIIAGGFTVVRSLN